MTATEWGFWVALASLVAGGGKFIDDYHIRAAVKSKAREKLIRWFVWLDGVNMPDLAAAVLKPVLWLLRRRVVISIIFLVFGYLAITTALYFWRQQVGDDPGSYFQYVAYWLIDKNWKFFGLLLAILLIMGIAGSWLMAWFVIRATKAKSHWSRAALLACGALLGPLVAAVGAAVLTIASGIVGPYGVGLFAAAAVSPIVPLAFTVFTLILIVIRLCVRGMQRLVLHVFDGASSPSISPFAYASALLGLAILGAKVVQAAVT